MLPQEGAGSRKRRGRIGGAEALLRENLAAVIADRADEFGAARFNGTEKALRTGHGDAE